MRLYLGICIADKTAILRGFIGDLNNQRAIIPPKTKGRPATERFPTADLHGVLFKRILCYHVIYNQLAVFVAAVHRSKGYQTADNHCLHSIALRYCWDCGTSTKRTGRTDNPL